MKTLSIIIVLLVLTCVAGYPQSPSPTQEGHGLIMYGDDHAFALKAPEGWVVNPEIGKSLGLHAVMYPEGSSWRDSVVTMYSNSVHKSEAKSDLEKVVAADISDYRKESPDIKVEDGGTWPLGSGKEKIVVKYFSGDARGNVDAVAYIDESKVVVILALNARTESSFKATLPLFKGMVASYRYITDSVTFPKGNR